MQKNIRELSRQLNAGEITASELASERQALAQESEGVFTSLNENWQQEAQAVDKARLAGEALPLLAGIPITLKDLYGVKGEPTHAGSIVLKGIAEPEVVDADVVAPLRGAGLIFAGRTNMSEFAFSGMGINPHYSPLTSVWDRQTGRLPGGSSSGSAVSVAAGITPGTLGSDTAGSCRIPAAFNGIVGVKPTYGRLSLKGIYPLSPSSDAPGPLAVDVDSCFLLDYLMSGGQMNSATLPDLVPASVRGMHLLIPDNEVMSELDGQVSAAFTRTMDKLSNAGCRITTASMPVLDDCVDIWLHRPVVPYEAWQHHREMIETRGELFDPFVRERARGGSLISEQDQMNRINEKAGLIKRFNADFSASGADALVYPTIRWVPPAISEIADPKNLIPVNLGCLRNTATANYFDGCSISLPCHQQGDAPVGVMLSMPGGHDHALYSMASAVEAVIAG